MRFPNDLVSNALRWLKHSICYWYTVSFKLKNTSQKSAGLWWNSLLTGGLWTEILSSVKQQRVSPHSWNICRFQRIQPLKSCGIFLDVIQPYIRSVFIFSISLSTMKRSKNFKLSRGFLLRRAPISFELLVWRVYSASCGVVFHDNHMELKR